MVLRQQYALDMSYKLILSVIYRKVCWCAMAKGIKSGGGSRKGVPNKITKELKDIIRGALDDAGGQGYLTRQAEENPNAFLTLVGKIVPRDINANVHVDVNVADELDRLKKLLYGAASRD